MKVEILDDKAIKQKAIRMAYEILEDCYEEKELYFIGIAPNGNAFATLLANEIQAIQKIKVKSFELVIDKANPLDSEIVIKPKLPDLKDKCIVLIDDVGNSGKTMFYALSTLMESSPKMIKTALLVERQHKRFPVSSNYVGVSLSTTLQEHIRVEFKDEKGKAYLM